MSSNSTDFHFPRLQNPKSRSSSAVQIGRLGDKSGIIHLGGSFMSLNEGEFPETRGASVSEKAHGGHTKTVIGCILSHDKGLQVLCTKLPLVGPPRPRESYNGK